MVRKLNLVSGVENGQQKSPLDRGDLVAALLRYGDCLQTKTARNV